jgi:hypothetical protein
MLELSNTQYGAALPAGANLHFVNSIGMPYQGLQFVTVLIVQYDRILHFEWIDLKFVFYRPIVVL